MDNLKKYQEFSKSEEKIYEFALKKHMNTIKEKITNNIIEGLNIFNFDFDFTNNKDMKEFDPFGVIFDIIIEFNKHNTIKNYYGSINEENVKKNNFRGFDINIKISDIDIDYYQLFSIIVHELKHVYDLYHHHHLESFDRVLHTNGLINYYKNNKWIHDFMQLNYLALKHETEARIRMLYDKLYYLRTFDKSMIEIEYKKTYVYKSSKILIDFNHQNIIDNVDFNILFVFTNLFLKNILKKDYRITSKYELINFFKNAEEEFKKIGNSILDDCDKIIDKFIRDNNPYSESHYLTIDFDYNNDEYVFLELLEIYNYIKF
jgi:hypothetical protein